MHVKAIFFDFDGVLFDLEKVHYQAWVDTLQSLGKKDPHFLLEETIGISDTSLAERFIKTFHLPHTAHAFCEEKRALYARLVEKYSFDLSLEKQILESLSQSYFLAIVSSSHTDDITPLLKQHALSSYFSFIVGGDTLSLHKPHPAPYLEALKRSRFAPKEVIAIEDSEVGLTSASKAHLNVIWLNRYDATPTPLQQTFPSCNRMGELPLLLSQI